MAEQTGVAPQFFHAIYDSAAPWDVGNAQPAIVELADLGGFSGEVLDVGTGTGDNAILLASRGLQVTAVDFVPKALEIARQRAAATGAAIEFRLHDVLELPSLGQQFDTVLDSAVLHVFDDAARQRLLTGLKHVTKPGGKLVLLCFSDEMPEMEGGPRSLSEQEIRTAFADGWQIQRLERTRFQIAMEPGWAPAWLGILERTTGH